MEQPTSARENRYQAEHDEKEQEYYPFSLLLVVFVGTSLAFHSNSLLTDSFV